MRQRRVSEQGFTLIEILIAMVVFVISVVGLVAMQKASITAAETAKQQTSAYTAARYVMTQLKTEISNWRRTTLAPPNTGGFPLVTRALIEDVSGANSVGVWIQYGDDVSTTNGGFRLDEYLGHSELTGNGGAARFCINYSLQPLYAAGTLAEQDVWRVRSRVTWTQSGGFQDVATFSWDDCSPGAVTARLGAGVDKAVELVSMASRVLARQ